MNDDPYWKLRPRPATPADEICSCDRLSGVILRYGLTENPLFCTACNNEVPPERIGFDESLADAIAFWRSVYGSLYHLWLDSGEYEDWAAARMLDPVGQVNARGQEIVKELNSLVPAYYRWFQDTEAADRGNLEQCPVCNGALAPFPKRHYQVCESCRMLI